MRARVSAAATRLRRWLGWRTFVPAFYWTCTYILRGLLWVITRWEVRGRANVPRSGAFILVSNHLNNLDPPVLSAAIARRRIRFMAKVELFRWPVGLLPRLWDAFPVRRFESDVGALLAAERILRRGEVLGMFPEGTRSRTGYLGEAHPGTALIALRTGATVLPCAITGTEVLRNPLNLLRRPRFTVTIGTPLAFERVRRPAEAEIGRATDRLVDAIRAMLPPKYLPPYTGSEGSARINGGDPPRL